MLSRAVAAHVILHGGPDVGQAVAAPAQTLSSIGNFRDERLREMSLDRFLYNIRSLEDPEILTVTSKAALSCAFLANWPGFPSPLAML